MLEVKEVSASPPSFLAVFYSFESISEPASVSGFICRQGLAAAGIEEWGVCVWGGSNVRKLED